jgi:hypothetical protein
MVEFSKAYKLDLEFRELASDDWTAKRFAIPFLARSSRLMKTLDRRSPDGNSIR